jgi:hypothetical protein
MRVSSNPKYTLYPGPQSMRSSFTPWLTCFLSPRLPSLARSIRTLIFARARTSCRLSSQSLKGFLPSSAMYYSIEYGYISTSIALYKLQTGKQIIYYLVTSSLPPSALRPSVSLLPFSLQPQPLQPFLFQPSALFPSAFILPQAAFKGFKSSKFTDCAAFQRSY